MRHAVEIIRALPRLDLGELGNDLEALSLGEASYSRALCVNPLHDHHIVDLAMVRISITPEAFEAIIATLPLGSVGYEPELNTQGERRVWIEAAVADRLTAMRRQGESYSDVILRLAEIEGRAATRQPKCDRASRLGYARGP